MEATLAEFITSVRTKHNIFEIQENYDHIDVNYKAVNGTSIETTILVPKSLSDKRMTAPIIQGDIVQVFCISAPLSTGCGAPCTNGRQPRKRELQGTSSAQLAPSRLRRFGQGGQVEQSSVLLGIRTSSCFIA